MKSAPKRSKAAEADGARLAQDFLTFAQAAWHLVCPAKMVVELPQQVVALHLEAVTTGELAPGASTLVVNVPPGQSKSLLTNVLYPAWLWARDPSKTIITVSHTSDLVSRFAAKFRLLVTSDWYRARWPRTRLSADTAAKLSMRTTALGERIGVSVGGSITGSHADVIVVDDLVDARDASNAEAIARANEWHETVLMTRWKNESVKLEICIAQRLHVADLPALLIERGATALVLPAQGPGPGSPIWADTRAPGDLLAPVRLPPKVLEEKRRILGSVGYAAQYEQTPVPSSGGLVRPEWLAWEYTEVPPGARVSLVLDTGSGKEPGKKKSKDDPTGILAVGQAGATLYLLEYRWGVWDFPKQIQETLSMIERYHPDAVYVEAAASGHSLVSTLRKHLPYVIGVPPKGPKDVRLSAATPSLEAGAVRFPPGAPWVPAFRAEVLAFPFAPHDEAVDVLSMAVNKLLGPADLRDTSDAAVDAILSPPIPTRGEDPLAALFA